MSASSHQLSCQRFPSGTQIPVAQIPVAMGRGQGSDRLWSQLTERAAAARVESSPVFRGRSKWVRCSCKNRCLFLDGCLPTHYLKQLAQECVRQVPYVERIVNRIVVANPCGATPDNLSGADLSGAKPDDPAHVNPRAPHLLRQRRMCNPSEFAEESY